MQGEITTDLRLGDIRHNWHYEEASALYAMSFNDLIFYSHQVHRMNFNPNKIQIASLLSIKTGGCPENCKYCPQSAHYETKLTKSSLMNIDQVMSEAKNAKEAGATRFCMGAAWRQLSDRDLPKICEMVKQVKETGMETCLTLGMITKNQAESLKEIGLDFYNHNIDSSEDFYGKIITSRSYQERLKTLENVREAGIQVCSGGIIGMGEEREDRIKMLLTLANLPSHPESVPINLLEKIPGTPLAKEEDIDVFEYIRTIAVTRIMMPKSCVRLSAGRRNLADEAQSLCFFAGANSIFYGEKLLTQGNPERSMDMTLLARLGIEAATNVSLF